MRPVIPIEQRLWRKTSVLGEDDCWPWNGFRLPSGHGQISRGRAGQGHKGSHVVAWEAINGPVPEGLCVCHHCDNPPCCNPKHLFLGTNLDNIKDMIAKGRNPKGEALAKKLNNTSVLEIRARRAKGETCLSIAKDFNISRSMVGHIAQGRQWAHLLPRDSE